jgi:hypothetical protein
MQQSEAAVLFFPRSLRLINKAHKGNSMLIIHACSESQSVEAFRRRRLKTAKCPQAGIARFDVVPSTIPRVSSWVYRDASSRAA